MDRHKVTCNWNAPAHTWSDAQTQSSPLRGCRFTADTLLVNSSQSPHYHSDPGFAPQWLLCERSTWQRSATSFSQHCVCERFAAVNPEQWGGNVAPDQTVADACISTVATRVSPGKVAPLSFCLFMSVSESLTVSLYMSVWSHARINVHEKDCGHCVTCGSYLIDISRGNSIECNSLPSLNNSLLMLRLF